MSGPPLRNPYPHLYFFYGYQILDICCCFFT